jgi:3-hydroxyisobutyrate dehydrogenase
MLAGNMAGTV